MSRSELPMGHCTALTGGKISVINRLVFIRLNSGQESLIQASKWRLEGREVSSQWAIAEL